MTRLTGTVLIAAAATLLSGATASAHGCHQGWQKDSRQGWHSHGPRCEPRRGIGISDRAKPRGKRRARPSAPG